MLAESLAQDATLRELLDRLVAQWHPEEIILFGSRARGEAQAGSDYDLLLLLPRADSPIWQRAEDAQAGLWPLATPADVLVLTRAEYEARCGRPGSVAEVVRRDGVVVYAA